MGEVGRTNGEGGLEFLRGDLGTPLNHVLMLPGRPTFTQPPIPSSILLLVCTRSQTYKSYETKFMRLSFEKVDASFAPAQQAD